MAEARKNVLIAGLGKFVGADPEAATKFGPPALMKQKLKEVSPSSSVSEMAQRLTSYRTLKMLE